MPSKPSARRPFPARVIGASVVESSTVWVTGHIPGIGKVGMQPGSTLPSQCLLLAELSGGCRGWEGNGVRVCCALFPKAGVEWGQLKQAGPRKGSNEEKLGNPFFLPQAKGGKHGFIAKAGPAKEGAVVFLVPLNAG